MELIAPGPDLCQILLFLQFRHLHIRSEFAGNSGGHFKAPRELHLTRHFPIFTISPRYSRRTFDARRFPWWVRQQGLAELASWRNRSMYSLVLMTALATAPE